MIRIADRLRGFAAQVTTILPRQLPCALHAPLGTACGTLFARQQYQSAVQVRSGTAQDIALAEQCRDVAGHVRQSQRLTAQQ
ncbi:hypothetical protein D3C87_1458070 [compost metagenome]